MFIVDYTRIDTDQDWTYDNQSEMFKIVDTIEEAYQEIVYKLQKIHDTIKTKHKWFAESIKDEIDFNHIFYNGEDNISFEKYFGNSKIEIYAYEIEFDGRTVSEKV